MGTGSDLTRSARPGENAGDATEQTASAASLRGESPRTGKTAGTDKTTRDGPSVHDDGRVKNGGASGHSQTSSPSSSQASGLAPQASPPVSTASRLLRFAIAALLLGAAAFKTYAIFTEPYFADSILGSPLWMIALVECEILLGLWLLSGVFYRAAWGVSLAAFVGFAVVNTYLLATGATTCGCFGTVETHPWVMLSLDLAVLAALVIWRPPGVALRDIPRGVMSVLTLRAFRRDPNADAASSAESTPAALAAVKHIAVVLGLSAIMLGAVAVWMVAQYGSIQSGIMALRGEVISIEPANLDVGEKMWGSSKTFTVTLRNHSASPVQIIGGTTSCKCVVTGSLPRTIRASESITIPISVNFTGDPGEFRQHFTLFTDSANHREVMGRLHGKVIKNTESTNSDLETRDSEPIVGESIGPH